MRIEIANVYRYHELGGKKYLKFEGAELCTPSSNKEKILIRTGPLAGSYIEDHTVVSKDKALCGLVVSLAEVVKASNYDDLYDVLIKYEEDLEDFDELVIHLSTKGKVLTYDYMVPEEIIDQIDSRQKYSYLDEVSENKPVQLDSLTHYYEEISKKVIGQDAQLKSVLSNIYSWQKLIDSNISEELKRNYKPNMFIVGSTGCGKTEMLRQISKMMDIPMVIEDANRYTIEGFVGQSVDDMLLNLIDKCDGNIARAQRGIIVIDEVDKLNSAQGMDGIATTGVQQSLISMMEGGEYKIGNSRGGFGIEKIIDTTNIQFIFMGSFDSQMAVSKKMGFGSDDQPTHYSYHALEPKDLIAKGMIAELVGRCSKIITMNNLTVEDYKNIIINSKISYLNIQKELMRFKGVNLVVTDEFIDELAIQAAQSGIGVRAVKTIISTILGEMEYEINTGEIKKVVLNKEMLTKRKLLKLKK